MILSGVCQSRIFYKENNFGCEFSVIFFDLVKFKSITFSSNLVYIKQLYENILTVKNQEQ